MLDGPLELGPSWEWGLVGPWLFRCSGAVGGCGRGTACVGGRLVVAPSVEATLAVRESARAPASGGY